MNVFQAYSNTKAECDVLKLRLELMRERETKIEDMYALPNYSPVDIEKYISESGRRTNDTQRTVYEEISMLEKDISKYELALKGMEESLVMMQGIEYDLYKAIVIDGMKPSVAVEKVSNQCGKSESTLWRNAYKKIKTFLPNASEMPVNSVI